MIYFLSPCSYSTWTDLVTANLLIPSDSFVTLQDKQDSVRGNPLEHNEPYDQLTTQMRWHSAVDITR